MNGYDTVSLRVCTLSSYLLNTTASSTCAIITNLKLKENALTFSVPLTRTTNKVNINLGSYLTTATTSSTCATITNLDSKEHALTFSSPLTRTTNTIGNNLGSFSTTTDTNTAITPSFNSYTDTVSFNNDTSNYIRSKILVGFTTPFDTTNPGNNALSSYFTSASASTCAAITKLNLKENV